MSKDYFQQLNYTFANEDTVVELEVLPENVGHVLAVAGSGSRILPLFSRRPKMMTCVDSSEEQLYITELRIESLRRFDRETFLLFWGYPLSNRHITPKERKELFNKIELSEKTRIFMQKLMEENDWKSILYTGGWERAFIKISNMNRWVVGKRALDIFKITSEKDYFEYLDKKFPRLLWKISVFLLGKVTVFNMLLYKGKFPKKNIPQKLYRWYMDAFDRIFAQGPVKNNFFLQFLFFGKLIYEDALPIECQKSMYYQIKEGLQNSKINYVPGDIIRKARDNSFGVVNFVSLSDISSYFTEPIEQTFLQDIRRILAPNGLIVNRYYLRTPEKLDTSGFKKVTHEFQGLINKEKTQMYIIDIYKKI